MAHIACAWELGGHLGHIGRFAALIPHFIERGHRVTLISRDLSRVQQFHNLDGAALLQAPVWMPKARSAPSHPVSMPEILLHFGYLSRDGLQGITRAWRDAFHVLKPDLLLCDMAPTALLATRDQPCVRTAIGSGYGIPPIAQSPMPPFRPVTPSIRARSLNAETRITDTVQYVAEALGQPAPGSLTELFQVEEAFLCTLPELDHYDRPQPATYWGLPTQSSAGEAPNWTTQNRPRVFAYIKPPGAAFEATLKALKEGAFDAEVYAPGLPRSAIDKHSSATLRIRNAPYDLTAMFATCDAVVCHAGHETVVAALLAGRPVVLIPQQMEQLAFAHRVVAQSLGELITPDTLSQLPSALRHVVSDAYVERAKRYAARHKAFSPAAVTENIVTRCEQLLR
ncbi:MAG: glycosyltransferase [Saccharospirillum sp.]